MCHDNTFKKTYKIWVGWGLSFGGEGGGGNFFSSEYEKGFEVYLFNHLGKHPILLWS